MLEEALKYEEDCYESQTLAEKKLNDTKDNLKQANESLSIARSHFGRVLAIIKRSGFSVLVEPKAAHWNVCITADGCESLDYSPCLHEIADFCIGSHFVEVPGCPGIYIILD